MEKNTLNQLKELVNQAYKKSADHKISLYLHIMDILKYYDINTTVEKKNQIKREYNIK